jgi:hypothetical protein
MTTPGATNAPVRGAVSSTLEGALQKRTHKQASRVVGWGAHMRLWSLHCSIHPCRV